MAIAKKAASYGAKVTMTGVTIYIIVQNMLFRVCVRAYSSRSGGDCDITTTIADSVLQ